MTSFVCGWNCRTRTRVDVGLGTVTVRNPARVHPLRFLALDHVRVEHDDGTPQTAQATLQVGNVHKTAPDPPWRSGYHRGILRCFHYVILRTFCRRWGIIFIRRYFTPLTRLHRLRRQHMEGTLVAVGRLARSVVLRRLRIDRLSLATICE